MKHKKVTLTVQVCVPELTEHQVRKLKKLGLFERKFEIRYSSIEADMSDVRDVIEGKSKHGKLSKVGLKLVGSDAKRVEREVEKMYDEVIKSGAVKGMVRSSYGWVRNFAKYIYPDFDVIEFVTNRLEMGVSNAVKNIAAVESSLELAHSTFKSKSDYLKLWKRFLKNGVVK